MSTKRPRSARNSIKQDGRVLLAIQAVQKNEIRSIREAARRFHVPYSTLRDRHKLTRNEEESLEKWILDMDARGLLHGLVR